MASSASSQLFSRFASAKSSAATARRFAARSRANGSAIEAQKWIRNDFSIECLHMSSHVIIFILIILIILYIIHTHSLLGNSRIYFILSASFSWFLMISRFTLKIFEDLWRSKTRLRHVFRGHRMLMPMSKPPSTCSGATSTKSSQHSLLATLASEALGWPLGGSRT